MYCHRFSLPCFFLYCIQFCIHNLRLTTAKIETKENHSVSVVLSCQQRNMVLAGILGDLELNPVDSTGYMATQLKGWKGRGVGTLKKFAGLPYQVRLPQMAMQLGKWSSSMGLYGVLFSDNPMSDPLWHVVLEMPVLQYAEFDFLERRETFPHPWKTSLSTSKGKKLIISS